MKASISKSVPKKFEPVTVSLTFCSQEELDLMGTLFNWSPFSDLVDALSTIDEQDSEDIRTIFEEMGANIHRTNELNKRMATHPIIKLLSNYYQTIIKLLSNYYQSVEQMKAQKVQVGKTYKVYHDRKGSFKLYVTGIIVDGFAKQISHKDISEGKKITIRKSLSSFQELKKDA